MQDEAEDDELFSGATSIARKSLCGRYACAVAIFGLICHTRTLTGWIILDARRSMRQHNADGNHVLQEIDFSRTYHI